MWTLGAVFKHKTNVYQLCLVRVEIKDTSPNMKPEKGRCFEFLKDSRLLEFSVILDFIVSLPSTSNWTIYWKSKVKCNICYMNFTSNPAPLCCFNVRLALPLILLNSQIPVRFDAYLLRLHRSPYTWLRMTHCCPLTFVSAPSAAPLSCWTFPPFFSYLFTFFLWSSFFL